MIKPFFTRWSFLFKLRFFFACSALFFVAIFIYLRIVPGGLMTYERSWPGHWQLSKDLIYDFKPAERLDLSSDYLKIVADPVYFSVWTARGFDSAQLKIKYRDHLASNTPIIAAGLLKNKLTETYDLQPIQNDLVDKLRFSWPRLADSEHLLVLQKEKKYDDVQDFWDDLKGGTLRSCPSGPNSCLALYNFAWAAAYHLPDYAPIFPLSIDQPLRGPHQCYVYLPKGPWRLNFDFVDLNQDRAADPITVSVSRDDEILARQDLADDNLSPTSGKSEAKHLYLSGETVSAGVHKVEIRIGLDTLISRIESSSNKLVFINRLWPVENLKSLHLFTDAAYVGLQTANPASLGKIAVEKKFFNLDKTNQPFIFPTTAMLSEISLEKSDIILENNSVFAFSRDSFFNPGFKKIDRYFSPADSSVQYVIAAYDRPLEDKGLKTASAEFSLLGADHSDNKYTFLLSIPGLSGAADSSGYIEIEDIQIILRGKTLWQKLFSLFKKA